jgi:hypothetical protein
MGREPIDNHGAAAPRHQKGDKPNQAPRASPRPNNWVWNPINRTDGNSNDPKSPIHFTIVNTKVRVVEMTAVPVVLKTAT